MFKRAVQKLIWQIVGAARHFFGLVQEDSKKIKRE